MIKEPIYRVLPLSLRRGILSFGIVVWFVAILAGQGAELQDSARYRAWAKQYSNKEEAANLQALTQSERWDIYADPDHDGLTNLMEYAAGLNPTQADKGTELISVQVDASKQNLIVQIRHRTDDPDLVVLPQCTELRGNWAPEPSAAGTTPPAVAPFFYLSSSTSIGLDLRLDEYICPIRGRAQLFVRCLLKWATHTQTTEGRLETKFTQTRSGVRGAPVESNEITPSGFGGKLKARALRGATLFVDGEPVGREAMVESGQRLRLASQTPRHGGTSTTGLQLGDQNLLWRLSAISLPALQAPPGTPSGYTDFKANVSETGAAELSVPISVPPGLRQVEPKLSLGYSSQSGNGLAGVGFSLRGLSAISRVGRTPYLDGKKGGISFDANDRFSLDGQRLILVSGQWGVDGAEYRVEGSPAYRIRSIGATQGGPLSWTVQTGDGTTIELGATLDSRAAANRFAGDAAVLSWGISRVSDSFGNTMRFAYAPLVGAENGYLRIERISYGENTNAGRSGQAEVAFEYADRPDTRLSYIGGAKVEVRKLLSAIESRYAGARLRRYDLLYTGVNPSDSRVITSITETGSDGVALPPTNFDWQVPGGTFFTTNDNPPGLEGRRLDIGRTPYVTVGDFNGDGRNDIMHLTKWVHYDYNVPWNPPANYFWLAYGNADGSFSIRDWIPGLQYRWTSGYGYSRVRSADFNADGLSDIFSGYFQPTANGGGTFVGLSTGVEPGLFTQYDQSRLGALAGLSYTVDADSEILALDLNGDGRTDILKLVRTNRPDTGGRHLLYLSEGNGSFRLVDNPEGLSTVSLTGQSAGLAWILPGDYNGDGLADILHFHHDGGSNTWLALSQGDGTFRTIKPVPGLVGAAFPSNLNDCQIVAGDFNGDGLTDFCTLTRNAGQPNCIGLCQGDGSFRILPFANSPLRGMEGARLTGDQRSRLYAVDFDGDGRDDLFNASDDSVNTFLAFANGTGFDNTKSLGFFYHGQGALTGIQNRSVGNESYTRLLPADFTGDGMPDIAFFREDGNSWFAKNTGFRRILLAGAANGHGNSAKFNYKPLTDSTVYKKGTGAQYPITDVIAPLSVVSSLTVRNGVDSNVNIGESTTEYRYENGWMSLDGRGLLGFKVFESTDLATGIISRREAITNEPLLAGRPTYVERRLADGRLISSTRNVWQLQEVGFPSSLVPPAKLTFPVLQSSVAHDFDINHPGQIIRSGTTSGLTYDAFGNVLTSRLEKTGGNGALMVEELRNVVNNDTDQRWLLGRVLRSETKKTDPSGSSSTRVNESNFDPVTGLVAEEISEPAGKRDLRLTKTILRDKFGNVIESSVKGWDGYRNAVRRTRSEFTDDGRFRKKVTNALGHSETEEHSPLTGLITKQTGPNGASTRWSYDGIGRITREDRPDGAATLSSYLRASAGDGGPSRAVHLIVSQSSGSPTRKTWFDVLNRAIRVDTESLDGRFVSVETEYNAKGQAFRASEPFFAGAASLSSVSVFDEIGRPIRQTAPGDRVTSIAYDGLSVSSTDPRLLNQSSTSDAFGRMIETRDHLGAIVRCDYDEWDNLVQQADPAGNVTRMEYDVRGRKVLLDEPNSGTTRYTYNAFGELLTQRDSARRVIKMKYDSLGRMISRTEPEGVSRWTYDRGLGGIGQLTTESKSGFQRKIEYDNLGRAVRQMIKTSGRTFSSARDYDEFGRLATCTYPSGFVVRNIYAPSGLISAVSQENNGRVLWQALAVNARGQIEQETLGNGLTTTRSFVPETGLSANIRTGFGSLAEIQNLHFEFDVEGNLTARRDVGRDLEETFQYDERNRLIASSATGEADVTLRYDAGGNIRSRSDLGEISYAAAGTVRPHAALRVRHPMIDEASNPGLSKEGDVVSENGVLYRQTDSYRYGPAGDRIASRKTRVTYDVAHLPRVVRNTTHTVGFSYGPGRTRYKQTVFQRGVLQSTKFYIGGNYEEERGGGVVKRIHYIVGGSGIVSIYTSETDDRSDRDHARMLYLHRDHLGSVESITDEAGELVQTVKYDPWGRRREVDFNQETFLWSFRPTDKFATTRGFGGHEMLDEFGLIHMGGRIYDPSVGRFLSPDPMVQNGGDLQNLNRYSYVLNNPLSLTDPSGFFFRGLFHEAEKFISKHWQAIAIGAIGIATAGVGLAVVAPALGLANAAAWAFAGGLGGFSSSFSGVLVAGGSLGDAFRAGVIRGGLSAIAGAISFAVLPNAGGTLAGARQFTAALEEHGVSGAVQSLVSDVSYGVVTERFRSLVDRFARQHLGMSGLAFDGILLGVSGFAEVAIGSRIAWRSEIGDKEQYSHLYGGDMPDLVMFGMGSRRTNGPLGQLLGNDLGKGLSYPFDFAESVLLYQGIPSAAGIHYLLDGNYRDKAIFGHSNGALEVANLAGLGIAPRSSAIEALPLGAVATGGIAARNGLLDPVSGGPLSLLLNPRIPLYNTGFPGHVLGDFYGAETPSNVLPMGRY